MRSLWPYIIPEPIKVHGTLMLYHKLDPRRSLGWLYMTDYEPATTELFHEMVRPGMAVADVGAQIGYYTLLAAKLAGAAGHVYAFEPEPSVYRILEANARMNGFAGSVETINAAVGDTERRARLFQLGVGGSLFQAQGTVGTVEVDVTSLDKFFADRGWPPLHLVKVDTEGAEPLVLRGMRQLVQRHPDLMLVIEFAPSNLRTAATATRELLMELCELGFTQVTILAGDGRRLEIPRDIPRLAELEPSLPQVVNLFCRRATAE